MPATFNVCPWALLMDMARAQLDGEFYPLECKRQVAWDDRNTGDEHILTLGASCYDGRLKKVRHEALHQEYSTILHSLGASRFCSSMMGTPTWLEAGCRAECLAVQES